MVPIYCEISMKTYPISLFLGCAFVMFLGLGACSDDGAERLVGTWELDPDAFQNSDEFKNMPDVQKKMALEMLGKTAPKFEFTKDTLTISFMGKSESVSYTVKSTDGDAAVIVVEKDGKTEERTVRFKGDDQMVMIHEGKEITLQRN